MPKPLIIFGAGGHGREILQILSDINATSPTWDIAGFLVDKVFDPPAHVHGYPVLGGLEWLEPRSDVGVVIAVGASAARRRILKRIEAMGMRNFPTLIHPRAWIGSSIDIGAGSIVFPGAHITSDVSIGAHVHVNLAASVSHDVFLGDYCTLGPGARLCGNVHLGEGVDVGAGSTLIPRSSVGAWSIIGAGTVVTCAQPPDATVVGSPARVISTRPVGWHENP